MKQKIVVKVHICCDKCRKKAMKIAASAEGVISVTIEGNDKDEIVVVGVGVDSAGLCKVLRKKLGCANLKSVEEMKDPKPEEKPAKNEQEENKDENGGGGEKSPAATPTEAAIICHHYPPNYNCPPPNYCYPNPNPPKCYIYTTQYEDNPNCAIM